MPSKKTWQAVAAALRGEDQQREGEPVDTANTPVPEVAQHRPEHVYPSDPATCAHCEQAWPCAFERGAVATRERIVAMLRARATSTRDDPHQPNPLLHEVHAQGFDDAADLIESETSHE